MEDEPQAWQFEGTPDHWCECVLVIPDRELGAIRMVVARWAGTSGWWVMRLASQVAGEPDIEESVATEVVICWLELIMPEEIP